MLVWFWCKFGATLYRAILTISNGILKTPRDNFDLGRNLQKMLSSCWAFFVISLRTMNCPYGHELAYAMNCTIVHELPAALKEWAIQFMKSKISNHEAARLQFMTTCRQFILKKYKAKMAESIEHDLLWSKRAVQFVKNWAVLFTFCRFYGII